MMHVSLHVFVLEINLFEFVFVDQDSAARDEHDSAARDEHDSAARDEHDSAARHEHDSAARDDEQEPGIVN